MAKSDAERQRERREKLIHYAIAGITLIVVGSYAIYVGFML